jgi:peptidyl-prolyl cis-trans isomerase C
MDRELGRLLDLFRLNRDELGPDEMAKLRQTALEGLIDRELLFQSAQTMGVFVEEDEVAKKMETLRGRFPDENAFKAALEQVMLTPDGLKSEIRRSLAIGALIRKEFEEKTLVSEAESKQYYTDHPEAFRQPEQIRASHILVKVEEGSDDVVKAEAKKRAEALLARVKKGEDFAALAKEASECPSAAQGGDLGFFSRGRMVPAFEASAFTLEPGQTSGLVETEFGYHILKLMEKKPESVMSFDEVRPKLEAHMKEKKTETALADFLKDKRTKARIDILPEAQVGKAG